MNSIRYKKRAVVLLSACFTFAAAAESPSSRCHIEPYAAEEDVRQFQYDSLSMDGQFLAVGWDNSKKEKGTYLLNLNTGERWDVPGFNNGASFSPDGKFLVNAAYVENGKTDIVQFELATQETSVLAEHEQWDWLPSYSPDGQSVLFNSFRTGNSDLYLLELKSGELKRLTESDAYEAHGQFSPDGSKVLYNKHDGDGDYNIYQLDLQSGKTKKMTHSPTEDGYASWSPDGNYIVFASDRAQEPGVNDLFIMSAAGELLRQLNSDPAKDGYPFWSPDGRYIYFNSSRQPEGVYRVEMENMIDCVSPVSSQ